MMKYIILLLLLSSTLTAQTKLRQIERSATKWHVPAAWDSIPGVAGHAMKYIDLETLMDTVGIQQFGIDSLDYRNDSLLIWVGGGYYFAIIPQGLMGSGDDGSVAYWHQDTIAGDTAFFWNRTNKRLGLNTKTPGALLHVKKNESSAVAIFENPSTSADVVNIVSGASTSGTFPFKLTTPSATTYISGQGFLGVNVSPLYPIDVSSTAGTIRLASNVTNGASGFFLNNTGQSWLFSLNGIPGISNSLNIRDVTNSRNLMTFRQATGNVGILNTNPQQQLDVNGRIRSSSLDTDNAAPSTSGTRRMVTTDASGDLSFANIPVIPVDSTVITQGVGIIVTESPVNTYNVKADTSVLATIYDVNASNQTISTNGSAGNITLSNGGGTLTLNVNDADASVTNELQTISTNGNPGNITLSNSGGTIDINVNDADASVTNELQTLSHASTSTTHTTTLSNSGGSLILKEGNNVTLTTLSNEVTIAAIQPTIPADSTVVTQGYGITVTESPVNTYNVKSDTSKMATIWDVSQVDQSATNELQTLSHASTSTTHTTTLSNSGGSLILKEGSNVTLTTSGNEVTIASTGGGGIDSTNIIGGWGIESVESPANTFNLIADSTQVASQYDLTLKQDKLTLTTTGTSGAATLIGSTLNVPQYQSVLTNPVTGTGTTNRVSKFTGTSTIGNSQLYDDGSTVGIGALNSSYKFYVNSGNMKLGDNVVANSLNKLYFGDGTFVYVGEDVADDRLYLRGGTLSINTAGSLGTNGQVLTSNGTTASWQNPASGSGTVTSVGLAAGTGISLTGTNPITSSGTITVTNSSPNLAANLSYTGTASPITLNSSDGTDVTFTAGSGITLSATGTNMTITSTGGGGTTNLSYGGLNTGGVSTYGDYVMIDNSSGSDIYLHDGDGIDMVRSASNYAGYKLNQTWGYLSTTSGTATAITTTATKINFASSESNGPITVNSVNDDMTVTNAGRYEFDVNLTMLGAADRNVTLDFYVGGVSQSRSVKQTKSANHFEELSLSGQITLTASAVVDVRILYDNATGTGTDINYERPRFSLKRLN